MLLVAGKDKPKHGPEESTGINNLGSKKLCVRPMMNIY